MPLSVETFNEQVQRLIGHYRPGEPTDRFPEWMDEMYSAFLEGERVTDASFEAAVTACVKTRTTRGLPLVAEFRMYVEAEWHATKHERAALPAPPQEDDSSTPEERQRWAKENAAIQDYANRFRPTPPEVLDRLNAADRAAAEDFDRRCLSVIGWPKLTPAQRRAKEQRIAAEKARVPQLIEAARQATRTRLDAIAAERKATAHPTQSGGAHQVRVEWADGEESLIEIFEEDTARLTKKWLEQHQPVSA